MATVKSKATEIVDVENTTEVDTPVEEKTKTPKSAKTKSEAKPKETAEVKEVAETTAETETTGTISEEVAETVKTAAGEETAEDTSKEQQEAYSNVSTDRRSVMSPRMATLFDGAIFDREVLTADLTGVKLEKYGCVATLTYRGDNEAVTVIIPADKMGLDEKTLKSNISRLMKNNGIDEKDENAYQRQLARVQRSMITAMLGAKVDFVAKELLRDMGTVIGDREEAMKIRRRNFYPTSRRPIPSINAGDVTRARIISVTQRGITVELSGYEVKMPMQRISQMAIKSDDYRPGDEITVRITAVEKDRISLRGIDREDIQSKISEYRKGDRVLCEIVGYDLYTGHYDVAMPNGCRGRAYYSKSNITKPLKRGDLVFAVVDGVNKSGTVVRVNLRRPK